MLVVKIQPPFNTIRDQSLGVGRATVNFFGGTPPPGLNVNDPDNIGLEYATRKRARVPRGPVSTAGPLTVHLIVASPDSPARIHGNAALTFRSIRLLEIGI